jgi:hypothetical protein
MKVEIIELDDGELGFQIPQDLIDSGLFLEGDKVDVSLNRYRMIEVRNLSCPVLQLSRFRRNLNGIMRNINNPKHHLRRVLIEKKGKAKCWCVPHDKSSQPAFLHNTGRD